MEVEEGQQRVKPRSMSPYVDSYFPQHHILTMSGNARYTLALAPGYLQWPFRHPFTPICRPSLQPPEQY